MELPAYHWPTVGKRCAQHVGAGDGPFIKKVAPFILLSTIAVWFHTYFGWAEGRLPDASEEEMTAPSSAHSAADRLDFSHFDGGNWKAAVASSSGLVAKENNRW